MRTSVLSSTGHQDKDVVAPLTIRACRQPIWAQPSSITAATATVLPCWASWASGWTNVSGRRRSRPWSPPTASSPSTTVGSAARPGHLPPPSTRWPTTRSRSWITGDRANGVVRSVHGRCHRTATGAGSSGADLGADPGDHLRASHRLHAAPGRACSAHHRQGRHRRLPPGDSGQDVHALLLRGGR